METLINKNRFNLFINTIFTVLYFSCLYFLLYTVLLSEEITSPLKQLLDETLIFEVFSILLLFSVILVVSGKYLPSLIITTLLYSLFIYFSSEKIKVFETVLLPSDFKYSYQLFLAWDSFINYLPQIALIAICICLILFILSKLNFNSINKIYRLYLFIFISSILLLSHAFRTEVNDFFKTNGLKITESHMLTHAKQNGLFTLFSINLLLPNKITVPDGYSESAMKTLFTKYSADSSVVGTNETPHIIVLLIEAFTDPWSSGIKTTSDPIPYFRSLSENHSSGNSLVPVIGGKSANSEFELLTGLSMRYLQKGSIPYIEHLNKPISSFVSELKKNGYQTHALHVANLGFFNYKIAYPNMGFDQVSTLEDKENVTMDVANRFPSDQSLVNEITHVIDENEKPKFIFAFPNSTHGFWKYPDYLNSSLDVLNGNLGQDKDSIKTYINALNTTDKAIESLVTHFQNHPKKTIILILGDHYPGILSYLKSNLSVKEGINGHIDFSSNINNNSEYKFIKNKYPITFYAAQHKVPYVLWTNFDTPVVNEDVSINLLHTKILSLIKHKQSPFFKLTDKLATALSELSMIVKNGEKYQIDIPRGHESIVNDYEMIQYDILHGQNYYGKWLELSSD